MGSGASSILPTSASRPSSSSSGRPRPLNRPGSQGLTVLTPLESDVAHPNIHYHRERQMTHIIDIITPPFIRDKMADIQCGDTLEFNIIGNGEYDVLQVYRDGHDYYLITNGIRLFNLKSNTPKQNRCRLVSLALNEHVDETYIYFCVIPSSQRNQVLNARKCPKENCEPNYLIIRKRREKIYLTDEVKNQKMYFRVGDTIEIEWSSELGHSYHIEDKKYCPKSAGLYIPQSTSLERLANGRIYRNTFKELGTLFLFRLNEKNQIHDIIVCIVNGEYHFKYIKITDHPDLTDSIRIQPNIIRIEQYDSIIFEWNTTNQITLQQIDPFHTDQYQQSIQLTNADQHFYWSHQPTRRGYIVHQFNQIGLFCYKAGNDQIGSIIVEPQRIVRQLTLCSHRLIHQIYANDSIEFNWKMTDSPEEPILINLDLKTSQFADTIDDQTKIYDFHCGDHNCRQVEPYFRYFFHQCETFVFNVGPYGLYNFAYSNNPDNGLLSVIVKKENHIHHVTYDGENKFHPEIIKMNRNDLIEFASSASTKARRIYQTDEYGNGLEFDEVLFEPQNNSLNYFLKSFSTIGIFYFSTNIQIQSRDKSKEERKSLLTVIVLPEVRFHEKFIGKEKFDCETIITANQNDFILWKFDQLISYDLIALNSDQTFQQVISSHDQAIIGKKRQCIARNCQHLQSGAHFFSNPDFERVFGSYRDRLISTVVIDPLFSQNCFIINNQHFYPETLFIEENDSVSWVLNDNGSRHDIYIQLETTDDHHDQKIFIDRNHGRYVDGLYYLRTFNQIGRYTIGSNRFTETATVVVYSKFVIQDQEKQAQQPQIVERIRSVSQFDTQIHLRYPYRRNASIYYTLDGSIPTRHTNNVHLYDPTRDVRLRLTGLRVLRTYALEREKLSSFVKTSSPTFVLDNEPYDHSLNSGHMRVPETRVSVRAHVGGHTDGHTTSSQNEDYPPRYDGGGDDNDATNYTLSSAARDQSHILLVRLTRDIEIRSQSRSAISTHPHSSYPGIAHYQPNGFSSESSST